MIATPLVMEVIYNILDYYNLTKNIMVTLYTSRYGTTFYNRNYPNLSLSFDNGKNVIIVEVPLPLKYSK